jgi:glycosyltransferase A (GT-A) superfamily protein (DUF2064 family)
MESAQHRPATAVLLFARAPHHEVRAKGLVGPHHTRLQEALLRHTLDTLEVARRHGADLVISSDDPRLAAQARCARFLPQRGRGFQARLLDALHRTAALGYGRIVLVGADTPSLCPLDLERALRQRPGDTATVGPSRDGGFYLLSLDARHIPALAGLPWGQRGLTSRLLAVLRARGLQVLQLPTRRDIDTARDLRLARGLLESLCQQHLPPDRFHGGRRAWATPHGLRHQQLARRLQAARPPPA